LVPKAEKPMRLPWIKFSADAARQKNPVVDVAEITLPAPEFVPANLISARAETVTREMIPSAVFPFTSVR